MGGFGEMPGGMGGMPGGMGGGRRTSQPKPPSFNQIPKGNYDK